MNNDNRNQARTPPQQADQKHPEEWRRASEPGVRTTRTAFHLRKRGEDMGRLDDEELKQVPVLAPGTRLQQGATYVDLLDADRREFTATGRMSATGHHAYVPKDRVPYEIWNRLTERTGERG